MDKKLIGIGLTAGAGLVLSLAITGQNEVATQAPALTTTRDSVTVLLNNKVIPAKNFIHLYDATPYMIMSGHIAAKLPCDARGESELKIVVGQAPDVKPVDMELVKELSNPGKICIYHVDLPPEGQDIVTDVATLIQQINRSDFQ